MKQKPMFKAFLIALITMLASAAFAADKVKNMPPEILEFIPHGWYLYESTAGDLNQDGATDYIMILEKNQPEPHKVRRFFTQAEPPYIHFNDVDEWESIAAPRHMLIFFAAETGGYKHVFTHSDWIERADFGGMLGDSFDGLAIENNVILLKGFGGSREKWLRTLKIRFQEDKWRMIGFTERVVDGLTLKATTYDMNLLNYKVAIEKWDQDQKIVSYSDDIGDKTKIYLSEAKYSNPQRERGKTPPNPIVVRANKNPKDFEINPNIESQIANGWHVIDMDTGDLNKDGLDDYVVMVENYKIGPNTTIRFSTPNKPPYIAIQKPDIWESAAAEREFMVFFSRSDGTAEHVFSHSDWVDRADYGGMFGDSFNGIDVNRGSILLYSYGGSREKWFSDIRIRYQENKWRMIGFTNGYYDGITNNEALFDRNLLTFKVKVTKRKDGDVIADYWDEITDKSKIYLTDSR